MTRRAAFREQAWPEDPAFKRLALEWAEAMTERILDWVWPLCVRMSETIPCR